MSAVESSTRSSTPSLSSSAELLEHSPRIGDRTGAVRQALVPGRRRAEQRPRVAGAKRADDHVVDLLRVLDRDDDRRRPCIEAEVDRRSASVLEQAVLESRVDPRARNEARSVGRRARNEPVDVPANVLPLNDALLDEELLERPRPTRRRAFVTPDRLVRMVVVVIVVAHRSSSSQCSKTST